MQERLTKYVMIDEAEMICRMVEAFEAAQRPFGMTASEVVADMPPDIRLCWIRASHAVKNYLDEVFSEAPTIQ